MIRLLFFSLLLCPGIALAQDVKSPAVAILRETPSDAIAPIANGGTAVLLDANANLLKSIGSLGIGQSISSQSKVQINPTNGQLILVENRLDRISVFNADGEPETQIPLENVNGFTLSDDGQTLICLAGPTLRDVQTVFIDMMTGKQRHRVNLGGVALVKDVSGSLFWSIGRQLSAFDQNGEVRVRRPLTRLPHETNHPTVINSRNWCGVGLTVEPNENDWWRSIWVIERAHPDVPGSKNRLFAVDADGQTRILVELKDVVPRSVACATYRTDLSRILVVDRSTGDLISFNSDGERMGRERLGVDLVSYGEHFGLWVVGRKSARRLDPSDLSVLAEFRFETTAVPIGLAVR